jgi:hypothetical protein
MGANPQHSVQPEDIAHENYLFFQKTPFLCLLNIKQTKIRGYFIFGACKFNNSKTFRLMDSLPRRKESHGGIFARGLSIQSARQMRFLARRRGGAEEFNKWQSRQSRIVLSFFSLRLCARSIVEMLAVESAR